MKYFLSEIAVHAYLPSSLDVQAQDRPRMFTVNTGRGTFYFRAGTAALVPPVTCDFAHSHGVSFVRSRVAAFQKNAGT